MRDTSLYAFRKSHRNDGPTGTETPHPGFRPSCFIDSVLRKKHTVSTGLKQHYLRSQMVNSEEGTPMGVGIWYEMQVSDPVSYLFNNADPEGSLQANVTNT